MNIPLSLSISAISFLLFPGFAGAWEMDLRDRGKIEVLDTAKNEVVYVHIAIDPAKNNERKVTYEMLTVGNRINAYGGYDDYQLDSIYIANPELDLNHEEYITLTKPYDETRDSMTIDHENNMVSCYVGNFFLNYYRYHEPVPEIEWELENETQEILGHTCGKATARWRGRDWTAWYSDIPIDAGPWKFQGLPGLILKLEDKTGQHYFEAIGMKDDVFPFGYHHNLYSRTTREKYEERLKDYSINIGRIIADSGMVLESEDHLEKLRKSKRRRFYAPIELE